MNYNKKNLEYAKQLRTNMTKEEQMLWNIVRAKRFYGYKFKRQVLIGEYIVDFLCLEKKLIIELDGGQHNEAKNIKYDEARSQYLKNNGYQVIRFWNNDIQENIEGVCEVILQNLMKKVNPLPNPLPREGKKE